MSDETRKAEAQGKTVEVEFRGHVFSINLEYDEWTVDLLESIEEGKAVGIIRGALGPKQWHVVKGMNLKLGGTDGLNDLSEKIMTAMGFISAGESPASSA